MASALVSIGKISLTVRYAALAPELAKKNTTDQHRVSVFGPSTCACQSAAVTPSRTPAPRYDAVIITRRPTTSNSGPSTTGPTKFPIANSARYTGARSVGVWKYVVRIVVYVNRIAL